MNKFAAFYLESFSKYADESGITAGDVGAAGAVGATGAAGILAASPQAREWSMSNLVRKPIGRVVTNLVEPFGYSNNLLDTKTRGPFRSLMSVIRDKPIYPTHVASNREVPYRAMFDLKPRRWLATPGLYTGSGKSFSFNPKHPDGASIINNISSTLTPYEPEVMGGYKRSVTPGGTVRYWDRWDVDLHPDESIIRSPNLTRSQTGYGASRTSNLARWAASKITKPVTISGEIPQAAPPLNPAMKMFSDDNLRARGLASMVGSDVDDITKELNARFIRAQSPATSLGSGSEPVAPTSPDKAHPGLRSEVASVIKGTGAGLLNKAAPIASTIKRTGAGLLNKAAPVVATVGRVGTSLGTGILGQMAVDSALPAKSPGDGYLNQVSNNLRDTGVAMGGGALAGGSTHGARGALVGAIGGGIGDIVNKTITAGKDIRDTDWKSLGRNALGVGTPGLEADQRKAKDREFTRIQGKNLLPQSSNLGDSSFYPLNKSRPYSAK